jgi:hypothetical protein
MPLFKIFSEAAMVRFIRSIVLRVHVAWFGPYDLRAQQWAAPGDLPDVYGPPSAAHLKVGKRAQRFPRIMTDDGART